MKLNLIDTILLALMVAILMIAGHQTYTIAQVEGFKVGVLKSYWLFMILFILMVIYQARKNKQDKEEKSSTNSPSLGKKNKQTKSGKQKKK